MEEITLQFDEGVKEILLALATGAAVYGTANYIVNKLDKRPEPIEQKIQALDTLEQRAKTPQQANEIEAAKQALQKRPQTPIKAKPYMLQDIPNVLGTPDSKARYMYHRFLNNGLTSVAALGIIANLKAEAGPDLNAAARQGGGGPGRGLVQWERGGRFDKDRINLVSFAKKRGKSWTDFRTQVDFILYELNNHPEYKRVKSMMNNAKTVDDATRIFLQKYEKAGIPHMDKRLRYAKELEKMISSR